MNSIKKKIELIKQNPDIHKEVLEVLELLIDKIEKIPDWVFENKCCPPGQECCYCS